MTSAATPEDDRVSLVSLANIVLRWRRTIVALGLIGAVWGGVMGLTSTRMYQSSATFIPQGSEGSASGGLALAAQLGIRVPAAGGSWAPPVYVALLQSRALLQPVAHDTVIVAEQGNRRTTVMELLGVDPNSGPDADDIAVIDLQHIVSAGEVKSLGAVKLSAITRWPSVSLAIARSLVSGVNRFNIEIRKSQATAERQFVEAQSADAERGLRASEDRFQSFLQQNRDIGGSPQLAFERDRLQRDVSLRQQIYTSLLQSREEAKIREVRDIPGITMIEEPVLARIGEPRGTVQRVIVDGISMAMLGVVLAFLSNTIRMAKKSPSEPAKEFFQIVDEATPGFVRRRGTRKKKA